MLSAFAIDQSNGNLTFLNTVSSQGGGPAHLSVDPSGKYVLVANYGGGNVAVIPILSNGALGIVTDVKADNSACVPACPVGPIIAANAPPGSFARSGHNAPHAHMIQTDPAGKFVIIADLGTDLLIIWKFDATQGTLSDPKTVPSSPGAGPRHFVFHPNGRWFYSLNEEASTLAFLTYDALNGSLQPVSEIQTLPPEFVGTNYTSEVIISADGRYIYALNRLHDTIAIFSIDGSGVPTLIGEEWTRADYPRSCSIDPTGGFLYAITGATASPRFASTEEGVTSNSRASIRRWGVLLSWSFCKCSRRDGDGSLADHPSPMTDTDHPSLGSIKEEVRGDAQISLAGSGGTGSITKRAPHLHNLTLESRNRLHLRAIGFSQRINVDPPVIEDDHRANFGRLHDSLHSNLAPNLGHVSLLETVGFPGPPRILLALR